MIVVMAAGLAANLTANPFEAVTTMTVQIVTLLTGDQEFDSAKTLAAFAIALFLLVLTLGLNIIALRIVDKYKQKYAMVWPYCDRDIHFIYDSDVHRDFLSRYWGFPKNNDCCGCAVH